MVPHRHRLPAHAPIVAAFRRPFRAGASIAGGAA